MPYQLQQLAQMLDNAMNHASVLTWGWFRGPQRQPAELPRLRRLCKLQSYPRPGALHYLG